MDPTEVQVQFGVAGGGGIENKTKNEVKTQNFSEKGTNYMYIAKIDVFGRIGNTLY